jgi:large subunit ribosomal protein L15
MLSLNNLPAIKTKEKRRLGRGSGSGRGKTAGRGTKGQKARHSIPLDFEGGSLPLIKRLPFLRGRGKNRPLKPKPVTISVVNLNRLRNGSVVDNEALVAQGLISQKELRLRGVKIVGGGKLVKKLTVRVPVSKSALRQIEKAQGKVSLD